MATANVLKSSQISEKLNVTHEQSTIPKETIILIVGLVAGIALMIVGVMNWTGAVTILIRPGESPGENPFLDFFVLGFAAAFGPYGFAMTAKLRRIDKIEERLPDFLRDVSEAG